MSFTEKELIEYDYEEYNREIDEELNRRRTFRVTPVCCEKVRESKAVFLAVDSTEYFYSGRNANDLVSPPKWIIFTKSPDTQSTGIIHVDYCPFCGTKLPEVMPVEPPGPIVVCTDGGYYCDTCSERLSGCRCYPPEAAWGISDR